MPAFNLRRKREPMGPHPDEIREQRLDAVKQLAERFTYDVARLIAGHEVDFEQYVNPVAASRLRASVEPFLTSGDRMKPNFGEYGELRVEGNLLNLAQPIYAYVEFDDQSVRETADNELISTGKRRMLITLRIRPDVSGIDDYSMEPVQR